MGKKDVISKEILTSIARDVARHILKIEIYEDMELINTDNTRVEAKSNNKSNHYFHMHSNRGRIGTSKKCCFVLGVWEVNLFNTSML